jgi:hypothetical protein
MKHQHRTGRILRREDDAMVETDEMAKDVQGEGYEDTGECDSPARRERTRTAIGVG